MRINSTNQQNGRPKRRPGWGRNSPKIGRKTRQKIEATPFRAPGKSRSYNIDEPLSRSKRLQALRLDSFPLHKSTKTESSTNPATTPEPGNPFGDFDAAMRSFRKPVPARQKPHELETGYLFAQRKRPFGEAAQGPGMAEGRQDEGPAESPEESYGEGFWDSLAYFSLCVWRRLRLDGLLFALQIAVFSLLLQHYLPPLSRYYFGQTTTTLLQEAEDDLDQLLGEDILAEQSSHRAFPGRPNAGLQTGLKQAHAANIGGGQARLSLPQNPEAKQPNTKTSTKTSAKPQNAAKPLAALYPAYETREYTVQSGESISLLAKRFGLNMSSLISVNNIERAKSLRAGQKIRIPNIDGLLYRIQPKDTLISIAKQQQSSIGALIDTNRLESEKLITGQKIFIPGATLSSYELRKVFGSLYIYPYFEFFRNSRKVRLSSRFGYRSNPFRRGYREFHNGLDIPGPYGSPVRASSDGTVATAGQNYIYGKYVILQHAKGIKTLYGHMSKLLVRTGQKVIQGQSIGRIGSTGRSTGPHVHFSLFVGGKAVNPLDYLSTP